MNTANPIAIVLASGGLDSTTTLAIAKEEGFNVVALSFRYGQRHDQELDAARRVVEALGIERHLVMEIDLGAIGGSALTDDLEVPRDRDEAAIASGEIPATYVPARNTILLSYALAWAEVLGSDDIYIGVNAVDYSGYPDCRPEFIEAFERLANVATKAAVEGRRLHIHAPLLHMTKAEIIRRGVELGVDYSLTLTCYQPTPDGAACGHCDACLLRRRGFEEAGVPDPTRYAP